MILWLVKLYWLWIVLGLIVLTSSVLPPGISVFWAVFGGAVLLLGMVFRKAMQSESFRNRIERNL